MITMLTSKIFIGYNYFTFFFYRFFFLLFSLFLFTLTVTAGLNDPRVAYWEPGGSHFYFNRLRFFISFIHFFCFFCFFCFTFLLSEFTFTFIFRKNFYNYYIYHFSIIFFHAVFFICIFATFVKSIISSI